VTNMLATTDIASFQRKNGVFFKKEKTKEPQRDSVLLVRKERTRLVFTQWKHGRTLPQIALKEEKS